MLLHRLNLFALVLPILLRRCQAGNKFQVVENFQPFVYRNKDIVVQADKDYENDFHEIVKSAAKFLNSLHENENEIVKHIDYLEKLEVRVSNKALQQDVDACISGILTTFRDSLRINRTGSYARHMIDAWGRPPSGLLLGNTRWLGQYYECIQAENEEISGKWCEIHIGQNVPGKFGIPTGLSVGGCFPDVCTTESLKEIYGNVFSGSLISQKTINCPTPPKTLYGRDIVAIIVICILFLLMLVGTTYDMVYEQRRKRRIEATGCGPRKQSLGCKTLLSFSLYTNTLSIIDVTPRSGKLAILDGMRFITMTWVIFGHVFFFLSYNIDNALSLTNYARNHFLYMVIANATFSVDTFFFIGGVLVAYLGFKAMEKTKGRINIPLAYLLRYLRLTPAYAFCILLMVSLYRFMGSGPLFNTLADSVYEGCRYNWWAALLYISNLYPADGLRCIGWGWYLACDIQFYIFTPFILMALYRSAVAGFSIMIFFLVASIAIIASLVPVYDIALNAKGALLFAMIPGWFIDLTVEPDLANYYKTDVYYKPYCRIGVYVIGLATGYVIYKTKGNIKIPKIVVFFGWLLATLCAIAIIYAVYPTIHKNTKWSDALNAFYQSISRQLWGLCMAWVTIACVAGYGGPVTTLLSWRIFLPLSKLTFCAYLLHPLILYWYLGISEQPIHFLLGQFVFIFLGTVMLSYGFGYVLSVSVELPFAGLVKILLQMIRPTPKPKDKSEEFQQDQKNEKTEDVMSGNNNINNYEKHRDYDNGDAVVVSNSNVTKL